MGGVSIDWINWDIFLTTTRYSLSQNNKLKMKPCRSALVHRDSNTVSSLLPTLTFYNIHVYRFSQKYFLTTFQAPPHEAYDGHFAPKQLSLKKKKIVSGNGPQKVREIFFIIYFLTLQ